MSNDRTERAGMVRGVGALPASPATVAAFLAHEADRGSRAATITRRCAAMARTSCPSEATRTRSACSATRRRNHLSAPLRSDKISPRVYV
jgi:hypothetical protein